MKCNNCGMDMKLVVYDPDGRGGRLIILVAFSPDSGSNEKIGQVMYCPNCGNLQVKLQ